MTLMQGGQAIAHVRQDRNQFILNLATSNQVMQVTQPPRAMMTQGWGRPTHLISKNKRGRIWHWILGHASNAKVIRALRLLTGMGDFNTKYDPAKIYSDSKKSELEAERLPSPSSHTPKVNSLVGTIPAESYASLSEASARTIIDNNFNSFCSPCVASKQTHVVIQNKLIIKVEEKLDEMHVNLWGLHHPTSLSGKTYAPIILDTKSRKTWVIYLRSKDEFVDVFQIGCQK